MRQVVIARPFAGGYRSDVPDYALEAHECAYSQDLIYPFGIAQQRWGWSYDGTTADVASNLQGVSRERYPITGETATVTTASNGKAYVHNPTSSGRLIWDNPTPTSTTVWLPRCMYNGEVILCAQDGKTPLLRYAGAPSTYNASAISGNWNIPAGRSEATAGGSPAVTWPAGAVVGAFFTAAYKTSSGAYSDYPVLSSRILLNTNSTTLSLDSIRNTQSSAAAAYDATYVNILPVGVAWPGVEYWDSGTVTSNSSAVFTFSGADIGPNNLPITSNALYMRDALLVINPTPGAAHFVGTPTSYNVVLQTVETIAAPSVSYTNAQYKLLRRLPFKDATVHKNSLWGTGVLQYPNRVYVGPPLWDIGMPPGSVPPFDPTLNGQFVDIDEFLLTPVDVPSRYDSDPVVAILSTPGPLLVLKGASVYGIYGTYPSYEQTLLANGSGCIDLRSAISVDGIAYWAGRDGVFLYGGGQIVSLTRGKIEREWQSLMRGYVAGTSYVSAAVVSNHLIISVGGLSNTATLEAKIGPDSANPSERTFIYDLKSQQWTSRMSNAKMRNMASIRVPGEVNSVFAVSDDRQGRVIDLTPTITGVKCTNRASQTLTDADPTDAEGTGPRMQAWSSASLAAANGIEGEARMLDMALHTNLYDTGTPATTSLAVSTAHGEALDDDATSVVTHSPVAGDSVDRVDRNKRRVNRTGRLHQLRVDLSTTAATTKKTQIPEVVLSLRDNRRMT